jgi:transcriptional regulator with XRE-family HTH domain
MTAFQEEPPAVARQRVRRALRQARRATPLSQGDVAEKLSWSLSKVQRIEAGEVAVSVTDLRALLALYDVTDDDLIAQLTADARISRRQRWLTPPEHRAFLTSALRQLLQFEAEATKIRAYQSVIIPGVLQTPAAAATVLDWAENGISDEERRVRYDIRLQRKTRILDEGTPDYLVVLDEAVIKRQIGGIEVMAEQLESLAETARRGNITLRLLPFAKGAQLGLPVPFQVLSLGGDDDLVAYRESYDTDEFINDAERAHKLCAVFDQLWEAALPEDATVRRIVAEAAVLRSSVDP